MRNIVLGLLALSASTVVNAEEESKEHPEWFIPDPVQESPVQSEVKVTKKGIFNCTSQESRIHSIKRNIAGFGGVSNLNDGDRYKFEYTMIEEYLAGKPSSEPSFFKLTGDYNVSCLSREGDLSHCVNALNADQFKVFDAGGTLILRRTYTEDWAGFLVEYFFSDSTQSVLTTPLTCKRTVLVGK